MEHRRKTRFRGGARSQRAASRLLSTLVPNFGCGSAALYYTRSNSSQAAKVSRGGAGTPACRVDTHVDACSEFGCGSAALYYTTSNSWQAAKVSRGGAGTPACRVDNHVDACSEFG